MMDISNSYNEFRRMIMNQIKEMRPTLDDIFWPNAIFMQNRQAETEVIYIEDLEEDIETEDEAEFQIEVSHKVKNTIKKFMPEYLAVVFRDDFQYVTDDGDMGEATMLCLLIGDVKELECFEADFRVEGDELRLEDWMIVEEKDYPDEAVLIRRAMTYQDE